MPLKEFDGEKKINSPMGGIDDALIVAIALNVYIENGNINIESSDCGLGYSQEISIDSLIDDKISLIYDHFYDPEISRADLDAYAHSIEETRIAFHKAQSRLNDVFKTIKAKKLEIAALRGRKQ